MASGRAPRHDFAPAWLNFPEQRSTGLKAVLDRDTHRNHSDYHYGMPRHRSLEHFFDERSIGSFRLGSYYPGYNLTAYRPGYDKSRYSTPNGHYTYNATNYRGATPGRQGSKERSLSKAPPPNTSGSISLEEDFPSLSAESDKELGHNKAVGGVWDAKTRIRILQNSQESPGRVDNDVKSSKPGMIYKASVSGRGKKLVARPPAPATNGSSSSPISSTTSSPKAQSPLLNGHMDDSPPSPVLPPPAEGLELVGPEELTLLDSLGWEKDGYCWSVAEDILTRANIHGKLEQGFHLSYVCVLDPFWRPSFKACHIDS